MSELPLFAVGSYNGQAIRTLPPRICESMIAKKTEPLILANHILWHVLLQPCLENVASECMGRAKKRVAIGEIAEDIFTRVFLNNIVRTSVVSSAVNQYKLRDFFYRKFIRSQVYAVLRKSYNYAVMTKIVLDAFIKNSLRKLHNEIISSSLNKELVEPLVLDSFIESETLKIISTEIAMKEVASAFLNSAVSSFIQAETGLSFSEEVAKCNQQKCVLSEVAAGFLSRAVKQAIEANYSQALFSKEVASSVYNSLLIETVLTKEIAHCGKAGCNSKFFASERLIA